MEESIRQLWIVCLWYFGISTTVTIGLFGWLMKLQSKISLGETIEGNIKQMSLDLSDIKRCMLGDYDKKGLIAKHGELDERVKELERVK